MAKVPPINAEVTRVEGTPASGGYDGPAAAGPEKWSGRAPAFASERTHTELSRGGLDVAVEARLVIPTNLGVEVQVGNLVTYERDGAAATRRVRSIEERSDFGFIRLHFQDQ